MLTTKCLFVLLATIAVCVGCVSAVVKYNRSAYTADLKAEHGLVFGDTQVISSQAVYDILKHLQKYQVPHQISTDIDELVLCGDIKSHKCTSDYLKHFKATLDRYAEFSTNLHPYLVDKLREQVTLCSEGLLNTLTAYVSRYGLRVVDSFSKTYLKFDPELKGIDFVKRVEVHADYVSDGIGPLDVLFRNAGFRALRELIDLMFEQLRRYCLSVDTFIRRQNDLVGVILELHKVSVQDKSKLNDYVVSCRDHIKMARQINDEVEQLVRHQSHRKDMEIWKVKTSQHYNVSHNWRDTKLLIYNQQVEPGNILDVQETRQRLEWIDQIQERRLLGIFKPYASNFEHELVEVARITDEKCRAVFPNQYKYFQKRHHSEPNILAYLENYYNIQLVVCMSKLEENVDATISSKNLIADIAIIRNIHAMYRSLAGGVEAETFTTSIIIGAVGGYIQMDDPDLVRDRLGTVKNACRQITANMDNYVDTMLAIRERELIALVDDDLIDKLKLVQFCHDILQISDTAWIISPSDPDLVWAGSSKRKRPADDIGKDKGKGKRKLR